MTAHPYWMSSKSWTSPMAQGGIFSTDGTSELGTANRVYVKRARPPPRRGVLAASPLGPWPSARGAIRHCCHVRR